MDTSDAVRIRINVGTSTKGVMTYDCTVELTEPIPELDWKQPDHAEDYKLWLGSLRHTLLAESDALLADLRERYGQGENYQPMTPHAGALAASTDAGH